MNHVISTRWLAYKLIHIEVVTSSLLIWGARMNILVIIKVKILMLVKWSYKFLNHDEY
jgi:hypothetical protein